MSWQQAAKQCRLGLSRASLIQRFAMRIVSGKRQLGQEVHHFGPRKFWYPLLPLPMKTCLSERARGGKGIEYKAVIENRTNVKTNEQARAYLYGKNLLQNCLATYFGCAQARFSPLQHCTTESSCPESNCKQGGMNLKLPASPQTSK